MRLRFETVAIAGFFFAFLCVARLRTAEDAVVNGLVVASDGQAVPSAQVTAIPVTTSGQIGHLSWTNTNGHGQFQLALKPGQYQIRAKAEADGYPDPTALFSVDPSARFPTIAVAQSDLSGVRVVLGVKGGVLSSGSFTRRYLARTLPPASSSTSREGVKLKYRKRSSETL